VSLPALELEGVPDPSALPISEQLWPLFTLPRSLPHCRSRPGERSHMDRTPQSLSWFDSPTSSHKRKTKRAAITWSDPQPPESAADACVTRTVFHGAVGSRRVLLRWRRTQA